MKNEIPSAEKIAIKYAEKSNYSYTQVENFIPHEWVILAMKSFAQGHVTQALQAAAENAETKLRLGRIDGPMEVVNKESILNAYPLTNIK